MFAHSESADSKLGKKVTMITRLSRNKKHLKSIIGCHGNHALSHSSNGAISHSSNGVIFRTIRLSIEGGPTKQFDAHGKLSCGRNAGVLRNLNAFTFDI